MPSYAPAPFPKRVFRQHNKWNLRPQELGALVEITSSFQLFSNKLCSDVPTQVQALSSGVTSGWKVTTGNSIGTVCGWQSYMADSRFPTMDGSTSTTSIDYNQQGLTGTIPTEFGRLTDLTYLNVGGNELTGRVPSEIGALTKMSSVMVSHGGRPSTVRPTRPASSTRFSRRRALAA